MSYFFEKQHTCIDCGSVFRYKVDPQSPMGSMMRTDKKAVGLHPCPQCGLLQPEMVMWTKFWHIAALVLTMLAGLVLLGMGMSKSGFPIATLAHVGVGVFAVITLIHVGTALADPNADRQENIEKAQRAITSRKLELVSAGTYDGPSRRPRNFTIFHAFGLLLVLAGPLTFFYPICYPTQGAEVPTNPDLNPSIVGPGDDVSFTFKKSTVQSIAGIYRGTPTIRVLNAKEFGLPETFSGEGSDRQWADTLRVPKGSSNTSLTPTIKFRLPKSDKLEGKTLRLSITMPVKYPVMHGSTWTFDKGFEDKNTTFAETIVVKFAQESVIAEAHNTWAIAMIGPGVAFLGGLWLTGLASQLQLRYASLSEIVSEPTATSWTSSPGDCSAVPAASRAALENYDGSKWGERPLQR